MGFSLFRRRPRWRSIQVEVSTACHAACTYCPRTALRRDWNSTLMPLSLFESLLPSLQRVRHVHLQGWGEPLLHPDLPRMVALASAQGCTVGTTCSGKHLTDTLLESLIRAGLGVLAFSLAGNAPNHDRLRPGTPFRQVLEAMERLQQIRMRLHSRLPHLHIAWLVTPSTAQDIAILPDLMERYGAHEATISGLSVLAAPELENDSFASLTPHEFSNAIVPVIKVLDTAFERGLAIHARLPVPPATDNRHHPAATVPTTSATKKKDVSGLSHFKGHCPEPFDESMIVTADGDITPCIMGCLPAEAGEHWSYGMAHPLPRLVFGNIAEASLEDIWNAAAYRAFRKNAAANRLPATCAFCLARLVRPLQGTLLPPGESMTERLEFLRRCSAAE